MKLSNTIRNLKLYRFSVYDKIARKRKKKSLFAIAFLSVETTKQTSLKIFKHYKLKPSFSITKDNKAKDRARGGGTSPPLQVSTDQLILI